MISGWAWRLPHAYIYCVHIAGLSRNACLPPHCCQAGSASWLAEGEQRLVGAIRASTGQGSLLRTRTVSLPLALHALQADITLNHPPTLTPSKAHSYAEAVRQPEQPSYHLQSEASHTGESGRNEYEAC